MKVYVYTRVIPNNLTPSDDGVGDAVYIYPIDVPQAKLDIQDFLPIVMDLKIPCGDNFRKRVADQSNATQCQKCEFRDEDLCDNIKYTVGVWGEGTLRTPPKLINKRRYKIDRSTFVSADSNDLITNTEKTEGEKIISFNRAINNPQPVSVMIDKLEVVL